MQDDVYVYIYIIIITTVIVITSYHYYIHKHVYCTKFDNTPASISMDTWMHVFTCIICYVYSHIVAMCVKEI